MLLRCLIFRFTGGNTRPIARVVLCVSMGRRSPIRDRMQRFSKFLQSIFLDLAHGVGRSTLLLGCCFLVIFDVLIYRATCTYRILSRRFHRVFVVVRFRLSCWTIDPSTPILQYLALCVSQPREGAIYDLLMNYRGPPPVWVHKTQRVLPRIGVKGKIGRLKYAACNARY